MAQTVYKFRAKVWLYQGISAWHFVNLSKKFTSEIKFRYAGLERGWGSLPVTVTLGKTTWKTSIFPDNKAGTFLLPLKASIRKIEKIAVRDTITLSIKVLM